MDAVATQMELPSSQEISSLGVKHLHRYWAKSMGYKSRVLKETDFHDELNLDSILLNVLNLGLEQTIRELFTIDNFRDFEQWILDVNNQQLDTDKINRFNSLLDNIVDEGDQNIEHVLSEDEMNFFNENGYIILRNAVPKTDCAETVKLICDFLELDINNPETWYQHNPAKQGIMVQLFQHPILQSNRNSAFIRKAYEQLWVRKDLWVNTDRVGFNPPETDSWKFPGPYLHWDVSIELPIPFGLQGILYLSDTQTNQGAFTLVPGFHNKIDTWINGLPQGTNPRNENLYELGATPIAANAGDFIIWHQALPHGSSPNTSKLPRIVQYINYQPVTAEIAKSWK